MESIEKRIVKACREDNIRGPLGIIFLSVIALAICELLAKFPNDLFDFTMYIAFIFLIFEAIARQIEETDIKVLSQNKLLYVVLSGRRVCNQICFVLLMTLPDFIFKFVRITTGSLVGDFILAFFVVIIVYIIGNCVSSFFEGKLK